MIEKPSPGNSTTPWIGVLENGGTNAATFACIASVNFCVSQVPSTIIAALPDVNWVMLSVVVRMFGFVHPLFCSAAHFENCASTAGDVHLIVPS